MYVIVAAYPQTQDRIFWNQAEGVYVDNKYDATRYDSEPEARKDFRARLTQNINQDYADRMDLSIAEWVKL